MKLLLAVTLVLAPTLAEAGSLRAGRHVDAVAMRHGPPRAFRHAESWRMRYASRRQLLHRGAYIHRNGIRGFRRSEGRVIHSSDIRSERDARRARRAGHRSVRSVEGRRFTAGSRTLRSRARTFRTSDHGPVRAPGRAVVIGDSIAHGVRGACRCAGRTRVGATPQAVLGYLRSTGSLSGRTVILSSGASNAPRDLRAVEAQLTYLRRSGASVALLGVGPRFGRLNPRLAAMAARHGARFMPIGRTRDGVHPANYAAIGSRVR